MELGRMDDIAGCRLIFENITELYIFRKKVHAARFKHKRRNDSDRYDYIKDPKPTGYRGIHDVYEYDVNSENGKKYKGLFVELQYRTLVQHAWATAVEVIGFLTESQPKFQEGDKRYEYIMALASEILARAHEDSMSVFPSMDNDELLANFFEVDREIGLIKLLRGLNAVDKEVSSDRNVILMFSENEELTVYSYRDAPDALRALFELEKNNPGRDIVLVRAASSDEVRVAFRNYFSDARDFIRLIEDACGKLSGHRLIYTHDREVFEVEEAGSGP
jgi:hypothetical protein